MIKKSLVVLFAFVLLEICGHEGRISTFIFELFYYIYFQKSSVQYKVRFIMAVRYERYFVLFFLKIFKKKTKLKKL